MTQGKSFEKIEYDRNVLSGVRKASSAQRHRFYLIRGTTEDENFFD